MMSYVAMDRLIERKAASDAKYRKELGGRPLRSHARRSTDAELLEKLRSFEIQLDRPSLERLCERALSAQEIAQSLMAGRRFTNRHQEMESDWVWICVDGLWRRWFPEMPSFERLDDRMQSGYELLAARQTTAAARVWLEAWSDALFLLRKDRIESIEEFDVRFRGTQSLFNWVQDLESELWNAGLQDRQFLRARIDVCGQLLEHFALGEDLITENLRRALADSHYELGETDRAEALYRDWLTADPQWGWGWIGWSDCHRFTRTESKDLNRAEELLCEGFAITEVRDRPDIAERLADLCEEQGRCGEAIEIRKQIRKTAPAVRRRLASTEAGPSCGKRPRLRSAMEVCRWISCQLLVLFCGRVRLKSQLPPKRLGEMNCVHAVAGRSSKDVAAAVCDNRGR